VAAKPRQGQRAVPPDAHVSADRNQPPSSTRLLVVVRNESSSRARRRPIELFTLPGRQRSVLRREGASYSRRVERSGAAAAEEGPWENAARETRRRGRGRGQIAGS
jgi:hypothetical protein